MRDLDDLGVKRRWCIFGKERKMSGSKRIAGAALLTLALGLVAFSHGMAGQQTPLPTMAPPSEGQQAALWDAYWKLPLYFIENQGQLDPQVKFYLQASGGALFFTQEGMIFTGHVGSKKREPLPKTELIPKEADSLPETILHWKMVGSHPKVKLLPLHPQEG
jgi:hypothetical protein